jgi:hypothetical protein
MDFLVPSLFILLLAGVVVKFLVPRVPLFTIFVITVVLFFFTLYSHYKMFGYQYTSSSWRDSIKVYAPTILIVVIVFGTIVSFANLFTRIKFRLPRFDFLNDRNTKRISNVKGYSEIPLSKFREIERQL